MAHFYGTVKGARGQASRCGTKGSGISTGVNGWSIGAYSGVEHHTPASGEAFDSVVVHITSGSATSQNTFGRVSAKRVGDGCEIRFDKALLRNVPADMLANHFLEANLDPEWLATFASIIASDEHIAAVLRAALWIEDRHVAPVAA